ncbi:MAG: hypothetical protein JWO52_1200, partial [Gammaproteobacteria bacterium]|nr:hypothetical protein [Gammaproteobacteria bacterium]
MKALLALACLLACSAVHASGVYTITSRVAITGPDSFGVLQPGTYPATYGVAASTPLASVSITGDAQFSLVAPCVGQSSCVATLTLTAVL